MRASAHTHDVVDDNELRYGRNIVQRGQTTLHSRFIAQPTPPLVFLTNSRKRRVYLLNMYTQAMRALSPREQYIDSRPEYREMNFWSALSSRRFASSARERDWSVCTFPWRRVCRHYRASIYWTVRLIPLMKMYIIVSKLQNVSWIM